MNPINTAHTMPTDPNVETAIYEYTEGLGLHSIGGGSGGYNSPYQLPVPGKTITPLDNCHICGRMSMSLKCGNCGKTFCDPIPHGGTCGVTNRLSNGGKDDEVRCRDCCSVDAVQKDQKAFLEMKHETEKEVDRLFAAAVRDSVKRHTREARA